MLLPDQRQNDDLPGPPVTEAFLLGWLDPVGQSWLLASPR